MPRAPTTRTAVQAGFTLVELMVTVAIVAIVASIAIPIYTGYIERSNVQQALQRLAESRTRMEQYFMDHRVYATPAGGCGFDVSTLSKPGDKFGVICQAVDNSSYTIQALGRDTMTGFLYTINEQAIGTSTITGHSGWASGNCWVTKPGEVCS